MIEAILTKSEKTAAVKVSRHEIRTRETHELLLRAAETIFIRDGYEGAELGEIAALADRTKGAIYGHFKSKEDIFLALIQSQRARYQDRMLQLLATSHNVEENTAALRQFFLECAEDEGWALLLLEFKLFTIRHPEAKKRLQKFYSQSMKPETKYAEFLGAAGKGRRAVSRTLAVHSITPMLSALLLEAKVEPGLMGTDEIKRLIGKVFDALLETA